MLRHLVSGCSLILLLTCQYPALAWRTAIMAIHVVDVVRGEIQSGQAVILAKGRSSSGAQASAPMRFLSPDGKHVTRGRNAQSRRLADGDFLMARRRPFVADGVIKERP